MKFTYKMDIGKLIEAIRQKRGMSKSELARRLEVSRPTIDRIIKGGKCDHQMLIRMGEILDYPLTMDTTKLSPEYDQFPSNLVLDPQNGDHFYGQFILEREKRIFYQTQCYNLATELKRYKNKLENALKNRS